MHKLVEIIELASVLPQVLLPDHTPGPPRGPGPAGGAARRAARGAPGRVQGLSEAAVARVYTVLADGETVTYLYSSIEFWGGTLKYELTKTP